MLTILSKAGPKGLTLDDWNEQARKEGIGTKRHATLYDIRQQLLSRQLVCEGMHGWFAK